ncbi:MAG: L-seryl-tRNA(Sec) selenium transferase [Dehalococcoidia bacterium]|nr:L-seryl-tRNA(Sec) selenium transferase [Dehalococcoidia bacterium]
MSRSDEPQGFSLRLLPSVEKLLASPEIMPLVARYSHTLVTRAIQQVLAELRRDAPVRHAVPSKKDIAAQVARLLNAQWPGFLSHVVNATGIILHTNLGRAPLSSGALEAIARLGGTYLNLESDLDTGERGARTPELRRLLNALTGAEDALAVNNNAAAVLLILVALAHGKEAIVSRGELVQIGGGFRVPEIMAQSGVILREVGTTNRTSVGDYAQAISGNTAILLKVHPSNFIQRGFVCDASLAELAELGRVYSLPVVYDLGSGALLDSAVYGLRHEPTVQEALRDGADLVSFSGDKLLGGPQAGIVVGRSSCVQLLLKHPFFRVARLDKLSSVALAATLRHYLNNDAVEQVPVWRMMALTPSEIARRAEAVAAPLKARGVMAEIREGCSLVGGGSLPEETLPTALLALKPNGNPEDFVRRLRLADPPLIARIEDGRVLLDLRTVMAEQDNLIVSLVIEAWLQGVGNC